MGFFENIKKKSEAELERDMRAIEEKAKKGAELDNSDLVKMQGKIEFATAVNLINQQQAMALMRRLQKAEDEKKREDLYRTELSDGIVDGFESPRERMERYETLDKIREEIEVEKSKDAGKVRGGGQSKSNDELERSLYS